MGDANKWSRSIHKPQSIMIYAIFQLDLKTISATISGSKKWML